MTTTEDYICNILIMGKTGVGKSSLLNYLCNTDFAKTGSGKPVTGEGIYEYQATINNQKVRIFDSWGIEAGKTERWNTLITNELQKHGVNKPIEEWFHSIFYCIQAGGARVEDIDLEMIMKFISEGYHTTILLTKADQISEKDEDAMKKAIITGIRYAEHSNCINIIPVCSEEKETRSGTTKPFGRDKLIDEITKSWRKTIISRMPKHIICGLKDELKIWYSSYEREIASWYNISGLHEKNSEFYQKIYNTIKEENDYLFGLKLNSLFQEDLEKYCITSESLNNLYFENVPSINIKKNSNGSFSPSLISTGIATIVGLFTTLTLLAAPLGILSAEILKLIKANTKASIDTEIENMKNIVNQYYSLINEFLDNTKELEKEIADAITRVIADCE